MTDQKEKPAPTLADSLLRYTYNPLFQKHLDRTGKLRELLLTARKFYLDDGMSAFVADLADYAYQENLSEDRRSRWLESLRISARPPHQVTWIEFDLRARMRRHAKIQEGY